MRVPTLLGFRLDFADDILSHESCLFYSSDVDDEITRRDTDGSGDSKCVCPLCSVSGWTLRTTSSATTPDLYT